MNSRRSDPTRRVTHVIEPNRSWLTFDWNELIEYRDLIYLFFRRDHVARYKQTLMGPAWYLLQPLATALIFSVVFGKFAGISTDGVPRMLFYLGGLLGWNFFAQSLHATSFTFASNADLFGKVYFPRLLVPISTLLSTGVTFALQFGVFVVFYVLYGQFGDGASYGMTIGVLALPLLVCQTAALALGTGLWISSLTARYRDLKHALSFLISGLLYLTPVIYPLTQVPAEFRVWIQLNPMTFIVEGFRLALLGVGTLEPLAVISSFVATATVLTSGVLFFKRTERTFVDTV